MSVIYLNVFVLVSTFSVHNVLNALKLTHVLCYDALWGQIRVSAVLPWKSTVEMCVLNEEFVNEDEVLLQRIFKKQGMQIEYISAEGIYLIRDPSITEATILLVVFEINTVVGVRDLVFPNYYIRGKFVRTVCCNFAGQ